MSTLDQTVINNALPGLQYAFATDLHTLQWVLTAYTLTQGVVTPTTAFFASRLSTKRFYIIALALFTLGSALCGFAWNLPALILFRVVRAVGGATLFPLAITLLFAEFPVHQRGLADGMLSISSLMAPAIGPTLGGYLVTSANRRLIFFINVPVGIAGMLLALLLLRSNPSEKRARLDLPGFALAATGLTTVLYALSNASISGWNAPVVVVPLIGGFCLLAVFVSVELSVARRGKQYHHVQTHQLPSPPHSGQTITAYVYVPAGSLAIGACIIVEDNQSHWHANSFVSLATGQWTRLTYSVPAGIPVLNVGIHFMIVAGSGSVTPLNIDAVSWN